MNEQKTDRNKTPQEALSTLMRLCSRSEKCSSDVVRLLYRWKVDPGQHQAILEKLKEDKFVDDRRYCQAYVNEKIKFSGWGLRKIRMILASKGIDATIIEEVVCGSDMGQWAQRMMKLVEKKGRSVRYRDRYDLRNKLIRYMIGLGYDAEAVAGTVEEYLKNIEND